MTKPFLALPVAGGRRLRLLSLVVLSATIVWVATRSYPTDLAVYVRGGRAALSGLDDLYTTIPGDLPFTYPPFAALLFAALALLPPTVGVFLLATLNALLLFRILQIVIPGPDRTSWAIIGAALGQFAEPTWENLTFGQINLLLVWLVLEDLSRPPGRRSSGILIGIAAAIKLVPAIFGLVLLARGDIKGAVRSFASFVAMGVIGAVLLPHSSMTYWTSLIVDSGRIGNPEYAANQSLNGLLWRAAGPGGASMVLVLASALVLALLIFGLARIGREDRFRQIWITALAGLLLSPISWSHHWVWLIPIAAWLVFQPARWMRGVGWAVLAVAYSRAIWWAPSRDGAEYAGSFLSKLATDAYTITALALLGVLVVTAKRPLRREPTAPEPEPEPIVLNG